MRASPLCTPDENYLDSRIPNEVYQQVVHESGYVSDAYVAMATIMFSLGAVVKIANEEAERIMKKATIQRRAQMSDTRQRITIGRMSTRQEMVKLAA